MVLKAVVSQRLIPTLDGKRIPVEELIDLAVGLICHGIDSLAG